MARKAEYKGFVGIDRKVMDTEAYLSLNPVERALLLEFAYLCTPQKNNRLSISTTREVVNGKKLPSYAMLLLKASDKPVRRAFWILEERGFIKLKKSHSFTQKMTREYSLTFKPIDKREPSNECYKWKKGDNFCARERPETLK